MEFCENRFHDKRMGVLLRVPHGAVVRRIERELAARGYPDLQQAHLVVFQHVEHDPGSRITWLADRALITKQSMGYLVDYLEERDYVERVPDPIDGRAKLVRMTPRGWAVHDAAFEIVQALEDEWAAEMGNERFAVLRCLLGELGEIVESAASASKQTAPA